jgi:hypothetical protein
MKAYLKQFIEITGKNRTNTYNKMVAMNLLLPD